MAFVYQLIHSRKVEKDAASSKLIGFYSTHEKAEKVIERYKTIVGFRDYPDDFIINKMEIDFDDYIFVKGETE